MRARALLWSSLVLLACAGEDGTDAADTSGTDLGDGADRPDAPVTVGVCPWMTFTVTSAIDGHRARQYLPYTVLAPYVNAPDGLPEHFRWSVTTPDGSLASIDAQAQRPLFMPTLPGPYTLRLERFDAAGVACETLAHEFGVMTASVHVVMTWRTPNRENQIPINLGAMKPDLDLHLLHSGGGAFFDPRWDCFFENSSPDWGAPGPADDPELFEPYMMDDALEVIAVAPRSSPSSDQNHRVGVHLWNDAGYGESLATVRVYVDGVLRDTWADVALRQGDLWESHIIDWPSGTVTRITNTDGTAFITPMYPVSP